MFKLTCVLATIASIAASPGFADTITVPSDYATIQEAIHAASDGDTILLDRNRFIGDGNRDLDFLNKELIVRPAPGRAGVRIDAQGTANDPHRPGFLINQTKPIIFIDLVFEHGFAGTQVALLPVGEGGGMLIENSTGVLFQECHFRENSVRRNRGSGAACFNSQVRFESCRFYDNVLGSQGAGYGVGLFVEGGAVEVVDCTFERGHHFSLASGDFLAHGVGAAFVGGTHLAERCVFQDNPILNVSSDGHGGGLYVDAEMTVRDSVFRGNRVEYDDFAGGGGHGGGAAVSGGLATFVNCLFDGNRTWAGDDSFGWPYISAGAALAVLDGAAATTVNCTFSNNTVGYLDVQLGVLFAGPDSSLTVRNSIVYGNTGPALATIGTGVIDVAYSDIEGGAAGTGNIDADPLFDLAFALMPGSPAIDAADNTAVPVGVTADLAGNPRFTDDPGTADTGVGPAPVVDMGAFEFIPQPNDCDADLTGDGTLDFFDVQEFLNRYSAGDLSVDFANDGVLDFFDVQAYLNLYAAGCP